MGTSPCLHSSFFPLDYGTIPQAEKQEKETSFRPAGAPLSTSFPGLDGPRLLSRRGRGRGPVSARVLPAPSGNELEMRWGDGLPPRPSVQPLPRHLPFGTTSPTPSRPQLTGPGVTSEPEGSDEAEGVGVGLRDGRIVRGQGQGSCFLPWRCPHSAGQRGEEAHRERPPVRFCGSQCQSPLGPGCPSRPQLT